MYILSYIYSSIYLLKCKDEAARRRLSKARRPTRKEYYSKNNIKREGEGEGCYFLERKGLWDD